MKTLLSKFKQFKNFKKVLINLFLASNLVLLSTGSAQLNSSTPSADLTGESTPSAEPSQINTNIAAAARTFKVDSTGEFIEDELVVKFKDNVTSADKEKILSSTKSTILKDNPKVATLIKVDPAKRDKILKKLTQNSNVEYAHLNQIATPQEGGGGGGGGGDGACSPNDYYYCNGAYQWGIKNVNVAGGWMYNYGSSNTKVAVIDSGIDYNHYDLGLSGNGKGKVIKGGDFVNNDSDPMDEDIIYGIGHGTLVAGVLGAITNNGSAIAGVNWYAKIIAIRVANNQLGSTGYDVAEGIDDAVN